MLRLLSTVSMLSVLAHVAGADAAALRLRTRPPVEHELTPQDVERIEAAKAKRARRAARRSAKP